MKTLFFTISIILLSAQFSPAKAGILDFRESLNELCDPNGGITTKKILLILAKSRVQEARFCKGPIQGLLRKCQQSLNCSTLVASYSKFVNQDSAALIGE